MNRPILSASNFGACILCPGKPALESSFGEPPAGEYALRGTNLHPYFKTDIPRQGLAPADIDLLERADKHADAFIAEFMDTAGIHHEADRIEEHELDLTDTAEATFGVPGHSDYVVTWYDNEGDNNVAILDLKSGMGEVDEAPSNWQLAVYAALVWEREPFKMCGVCIVQPDNFGPRVTTALYRSGQMPGVIESIRQGKLATEGPYTPRVPGEEQCRYCRAKAVCPEYRAGFAVVTVDKPLAVATLVNDDLAALKRVINRAKQLESEVTEEIRQRIVAGTIEGWKLRNTGSTRTLTAPLPALRAIQGYLAEQHLPEMSAKAFDGARKLVWGELESLFATLTGYTQKRAKEVLKELLAPVTLETPKNQAVVEDTK